MPGGSWGSWTVGECSTTDWCIPSGRLWGGQHLSGMVVVAGSACGRARKTALLAAVAIGRYHAGRGRHQQSLSAGACGQVITCGCIRKLVPRAPHAEQRCASAMTSAP